MGDSRIGQLCWYQEYDNVSRSFGDWQHGVLRAWSVDSDADCPSLFPVGIIESRTGAMVVTAVRAISFSKSCPENDLHNPVLLEFFGDVVYLRRVVEHLYDLLDDIDSASDAAKDNDAAYRRMVMNLQERRNESGVKSNGHHLLIGKKDFRTNRELREG